MSKATPSIDFVCRDEKQIKTYSTMLQKVYRNLVGVINGGIGYGDGSNSDNIDGVWQTVTFANASTNQTITHNLGRVPVGYHVVQKSAACDIFSGTIAWTTTQLTLQSTVVGVMVKLFIF